jgi:hypothetical protein
MTTRHQDIDARIRNADPIDAEQLAAAWAQSSARWDLPAKIASGVTSHPPVPPRPWHRRRTRVIAAVAVAAALLLGGWTAYQESITLPAPSERSARFQRSVPDDYSIECGLPGGLTVFTSEWAFTGESVYGTAQIPVDPTGACADAWESEELEPPELTAYRKASGEIVVLPSDRDVPASWRPYVYEPVAAPVLELQTSLVDYVDGLQSSCFAADRARAFAERERRRLGLDDWRVTVRDVPARAAARGCAGAVLHRDDELVEIVPGLDVGAREHPAERLADEVRAMLAGRCRPLGQAAARIEELLQEPWINEFEWSVKKVVDDDADCARVDINVDNVELPIDVRGPAAGDNASDRDR